MERASMCSKEGHGASGPAAKKDNFLALPKGDREDNSCDPMSYMKTLSNWGKWGKDDVLGTLNYITPAMKVAAAGLVKTGETIGLGWRVDLTARNIPQRLMMVIPNDPEEHGGGK